MIFIIQNSPHEAGYFYFSEAVYYFVELAIKKAEIGNSMRITRAACLPVGGATGSIWREAHYK